MQSQQPTLLTKHKNFSGKAIRSQYHTATSPPLTTSLLRAASNVHHFSHEAHITSHAKLTTSPLRAASNVHHFSHEAHITSHAKLTTSPLRAASNVHHFSHEAHITSHAKLTTSPLRAASNVHHLSREAHNMATYGASSDVDMRYALTSGLRSSTHVSTESSPVEVSPLEGYEDIPMERYTGIRDLRKRVQAVTDALQAGRTTKQYLIFMGVTEDNLAQIDSQRATIGKHIRMTHYTDINLLIVKLPTAEHEAVHISFAYRTNRKLEAMGLPDESLYGMGGTAFKGFRCSKEGDSTYKPESRDGKACWPTIVFEAGFSESLPKLRTDAAWWLTNSRGDVKIVVVVSIRRPQRMLLIEQWCMAPHPGPSAATRTRSNANAPLQVPRPTQELTIIQDPPIPPLPNTVPTYTVTGAPLTFDFAKLLLRAPVPPEGNVIFTAADLQAFALRYWRAVN